MGGTLLQAARVLRGSCGLQLLVSNWSLLPYLRPRLWTWNWCEQMECLWLATEWVGLLQDEVDGLFERKIAARAAAPIEPTLKSGRGWRDDRSVEGKREITCSYSEATKWDNICTLLCFVKRLRVAHLKQSDLSVCAAAVFPRHISMSNSLWQWLIWLV